MTDAKQTPRTGQSDHGEARNTGERTYEAPVIRRIASEAMGTRYPFGANVDGYEGSALG